MNRQVGALVRVSHSERFKDAWPRVAFWRLLCMFHIEAFHRIPGLAFRMWLEPQFRSVGSLAVFALGARYEPALELLPKVLRAGDVLFDCGANQGIYSIVAAACVGDNGRVIAVEPQPYAARSIRLTCAFNGLGQVSVEEVAISDAVGEAGFSVTGVRVAASLVYGEANMVVKTNTIDALASAYNLDQVNYIKLDVEGAELAALNGAVNVIRKFQPIVQFESFDLTDIKCRAVWDWLALEGYAFFEPSNGGLRPLNGPVEGYDVVAVHTGRKDNLLGLGVVFSS